MNTPCLELVVFKIKDPANARKARRLAQDAVKHYEGFLSWSAYEGAEDETLFADVVQWRDLPAAKAAADAIVKDPQFAAVMKEIDGIVTMSHFNLDRTVPA
jgi:quinol monooxygenase YgiN